MHDKYAGALLYIKPEFQLENSPALEGMVVASTLVGAWLSTLCSGPGADWLGRRIMLCVSGIIYSVSAIIMLWSPNVYVLIACRLLTGTGIGLAVTIIPIYISESAPAEIRGQLSTLPQLMGSGGLFLAYIMVFTLSLTAYPNWRYMLGFLSVPSAFFLALALFYLPESPRWLVSKGRMREAKQVLQQLRNKTDVAAELALLVEGLGIGADTALEEWLLPPAEFVTENEKLGNEDGALYTTEKPDEGISWIASSFRNDNSVSQSFFSRRASVGPNSLPLMDPMVAIIGSMRSTQDSKLELPESFEEQSDQWDEEENETAAIENGYQSDSGVIGELDENLTAPLISRPASDKPDLPPRPPVRETQQREGQSGLQVRHGSILQNSLHDIFGSLGWKQSNSRTDFPSFSRASSRYTARYGSLTSNTLPASSIPASIGSVGIGGGWQLAWIRTKADDAESKNEGDFKRVFLLQDTVAPLQSASALSLPRGIEADSIPAAALVGQPAQFSMRLLRENPVGPAMVHPAETAVHGPAWRDLLEGGVLRALIVGVGLQILQQFSGINAVLYFVPQILEQSGAESLLASIGVGPDSASILASSVTCFLMLPCILFAMRLMDKAGRRQMLLVTLPILFFSLVAMVISFIILPVGLLQAAASFVGVTVYICTFVMGFGPIPNILGSEIFPTRVRGVCIAICQATMWTCNIIMTNLFPILLLQLGIGGVFGIFAIMSLLSWIFVFLKVPETKGMPLEVISDFFAMSAVNAGNSPSPYTEGAK
ncbi:hypothetical protein O6H91_09G043300 [Diphasiastrum complanatum]|uniref:Uncharacterized protein n=1 Tax=Diphasiastrum complanatum TaxID=34168 RepID=A0ACC2CNR7_DIPCM|nr:hypothetical protein O6H91_09G043300 [Diphasiastrum complanatum]